MPVTREDTDKFCLVLDQSPFTRISRRSQMLHHLRFIRSNNLITAPRFIFPFLFLPHYECIRTRYLPCPRPGLNYPEKRRCVTTVRDARARAHYDGAMHCASSVRLLSRPYHGADEAQITQGKQG